MDADKTLYPAACDYLASKHRLDQLMISRSMIDADIDEESHIAAQLAATIIRSMRAAGLVLTNTERPEVIVLLEDRLEIHSIKPSGAVPLVAEDVPSPADPYSRVFGLDPEPSLEEAIAEAQTHRTVWGDVAISDGGFLTKILTGWTPPTDAEIDAAAASGAIDDVFHADEEVE
jgi:hypothetical protein